MALAEQAGPVYSGGEAPHHRLHILPSVAIMTFRVFSQLGCFSRSSLSIASKFLKHPSSSKVFTRYFLSSILGRAAAEKSLQTLHTLTPLYSRESFVVGVRSHTERGAVALSAVRNLEFSDRTPPSGVGSNKYPINNPQIPPALVTITGVILALLWAR